MRRHPCGRAYSLRGQGRASVRGDRRLLELMLVPRDKEVHEYGERIRKRIPARFKQVLKRMKMKKYLFAKEAGISRSMLAYIESGEFIPGPCVMAQISCAAGMTLTEFV